METTAVDILDEGIGLRRPTTRPLRLAMVCATGGLVFVCACHQVPTSSEQTIAPGRTDPGPAKQLAEPSVVPQRRIEIPADIDDPAQWLWVEKGRDGAEGAWATGSFDSNRNKLSIQARDVRRFTIDVARIPIDWKRLVILSINGRNSELRRRNHTRLHFVLDEYGQWMVAEP